MTWKLTNIAISYLHKFVSKQAVSHKNSPPTLYVWNCWSGSLVSIIRSNIYDDLTPPSNCPIGVSSSSSYDISRDSWNSSYLTRRHWVSGRILSKPSNWWNKQYRNLKTICKTIYRRFIRRWKKKRKSYSSPTDPEFVFLEILLLLTLRISCKINC